jgi:hypothetical protein
MMYAVDCWWSVCQEIWRNISRRGPRGATVAFFMLAIQTDDNNPKTNVSSIQFKQFISTMAILLPISIICRSHHSCSSKYAAAGTANQNSPRRQSQHADKYNLMSATPQSSEG